MTDRRKAKDNAPTAIYARLSPAMPLALSGLLVAGAVMFVLSIAPLQDRGRRASDEPAGSMELDEATDFSPTDYIPEAVLAPARLIKTVALGPGETLIKLMTRAGAEPADSLQAIAALSALVNPRRLRMGQEITLTFEQDGDDFYRLAALDLADSAERVVAVVRAEQGFTVEETLHRFERIAVRAGGTIDGSLYEAGIAAGLTMSLLADIVRIFSYDVDFQRDIQRGDKFDVLFERAYDTQGRPVKEGRILAASLTLRGQDLRFYLYTPSDDGQADYFNANGQSVRKTLLRTPIDGAKLTSGFGRRNHPIMGFTTAHQGVDFGAPSGTPIQAAGDGIVEMAGVNGGYGKYVRLRHSGGYATAYGHMSRIAAAQGTRVRQGQIIGHVGSTGLSTGPHLHYEVLLANRQINPLSVRMPSGRKLQGVELARFHQALEDIETQMANAQNRAWYASAQ